MIKIKASDVLPKKSKVKKSKALKFSELVSLLNSADIKLTKRSKKRKVKTEEVVKDDPR